MIKLHFVTGFATRFNIIFDVSEASGSMGGTFSASSGSLGGLESAFGKPEAEEKIGTGYGEKLAMNTRKVTFNRLTETPFETLALRYESRATLIKLGVISEVAKPNPFPADVGVKTPPGWKG